MLQNSTKKRLKENQSKRKEYTYSSFQFEYWNVSICTESIAAHTSQSIKDSACTAHNCPYTTQQTVHTKHCHQNRSGDLPWNTTPPAEAHAAILLRSVMAGLPSLPKSPLPTEQMHSLPDQDCHIARVLGLIFNSRCATLSTGSCIDKCQTLNNYTTI